MATKPKVVVIGGGMAGIGCAAAIADCFDVTVLEQEIQPGYHSTGRSAAVFHKAFESDLVHRLSVWSESFFQNPLPGFESVAHPLLHIRVGTNDDKDSIDEFLERWIDRCPWLYPLNQSDLRNHVPSLTDSMQIGVMDEQSLKLDVHNLLTGFRKMLRERGGEVLTQARVEAIDWRGTHWRINCVGGIEIDAEILVNAAGAWADSIATLAGIEPKRLQPKRRTALLVDPVMDISEWPMCYRENLYFKPDAGLLLVSPADEIDTEPCDAQPELIDVATAIERLQETITMQVDRPQQMWAGLRTFAPDRLPVIGFDPDHAAFFWVAALGGYGIQTSPAYREIVRRLINRQGIPEDMGIDEFAITPGRMM